MIKLFSGLFFYSLAFMTTAAIVQPTELNNSPLQLLEKKKNTTNSPTQPQSTTNHTPTTIQATKQTAPPIQILEQKGNHTPSFSQQQRETIHRSHSTEDILFHKPSNESARLDNFNEPNRYDGLETFTKKLNDEYGDNIFVQESLSTLYEAKQLWDETDSLANDFTSDIVITLKLDKFISNDLTNSQHSLQNSTAYVFLKKDISPSTQHHQESGISFYQAQQTPVVPSKNGLNPLISYFVASFFQVTTLYYLLALSILYMFLGWALKFVLRLFP